jgi:cytochrome c nitrite reductase small subunit
MRRSLFAPVWAARVTLGAAVGLATGVGAYTFVYARGASYMTNDPAACANCHVMRDYYDGWAKSSHRAVAVCNDCHTPEGFWGKYRSKLSNGFWHSFAFTAGRFPEPLRIKPHNRAITEARCVGCHAEVAEAMTPEGGAPPPCIRCHGAVGHPR